MVERSDRAPLLDWEEVPSAEKPGGGAAPPAAKDRLSSPSNSRAPAGCSAPGFGWSSGPGGPTPSRAVSNADGCSAPPATSSTPAAGGRDEALRPDDEEHHSDAGSREVTLEERMVKWEEKDQIVSVFVVTFNTRSGGTYDVQHEMTMVDIKHSVCSQAREKDQREFRAETDESRLV